MQGRPSWSFFFSAVLAASSPRFVIRADHADYGSESHGGGDVPAVWEAILTVDEHEALRARLNDPSRLVIERVDRQAKRWVLAGFVRCGNPECESRLDGKTQHRSLRDGTPAVRQQYVCTSANGGCSKIAITAPDLERHVLAAALERMKDVPEPEPPAPERQTELLAELRTLEQRKDGLAHELADGLDPRVVRTATADINARLAVLRAELARQAARSKPRRPKLWVSLDAPDEFIDGSLPELPPEWIDATRSLLDYLGAAITVGRARSRGVRFDESRVSITWR